MIFACADTGAVAVPMLVRAAKDSWPAVIPALGAWVIAPCADNEQLGHVTGAPSTRAVPAATFTGPAAFMAPLRVTNPTAVGKGTNSFPHMIAPVVSNVIVLPGRLNLGEAPATVTAPPPPPPV